MGKAKPIDQCKTAADFDRAIRASGQPYSERQNGTSHKVYRVNGTSIPVPQHSGEIPTGTRRSIIKMLIKAGVVCFILFKVAAFIAPIVQAGVPGFN